MLWAQRTQVFYKQRSGEWGGGHLGSGHNGGRNMNLNEAGFIDLGPLSGDSGSDVVAHGVKGGIVVV